MITQSLDDDGNVGSCRNLHLLSFWNKFAVQPFGRVTSKVEILVFYKHKNAVLFAEGFDEKFLFRFQAQSWPRLFRTLPLMLLRQTAAYKCFQIFVKSCLQPLCVCNRVL